MIHTLARTACIALVGAIVLCLSGCLPRILANKALSRAEPKERQVKPLYPIFEGMLDGTDAIQVRSYRVGLPEIAMSTLIVEPRDYDLDISSAVRLSEETGEHYLDIAFSHESRDIFRLLLAPGATDTIEQAAKSAVSDIAPEDAPEYLRSLMQRQGDQRITPRPRTIFLLGGYGVPKEAMLPWALTLAQGGYRVITPDFRGQGDSGGDGVRWGRYEPHDLRQLLDSLRQDGVVDSRPIGVYGISYGAAMGILWAAYDDRIATVVAASPYDRPDEVMDRFVENYSEDIRIPGLTPKVVDRGSDLIEVQLGINWSQISPVVALTAVNIPILYIGSDADKVNPPATLQQMHRQSPTGSELIQLKDIPHELLGFNIDDLDATVLEWFRGEL